MGATKLSADSSAGPSSSFTMISTPPGSNTPSSVSSAGPPSGVKSNVEAVTYAPAPIGSEYMSTSPAASAPSIPAAPEGPGASGIASARGALGSTSNGCGPEITRRYVPNAACAPANPRSGNAVTPCSNTAPATAGTMNACDEVRPGLASRHTESAGAGGPGKSHAPMYVSGPAGSNVLAVYIAPATAG